LAPRFAVPPEIRLSASSLPRDASFSDSCRDVAGVFGCGAAMIVKSNFASSRQVMPWNSPLRQAVERHWQMPARKQLAG